MPGDAKAELSHLRSEIARLEEAITERETSFYRAVRLCVGGTTRLVRLAPKPARSSATPGGSQAAQGVGPDLQRESTAMSRT